MTCDSSSGLEKLVKESEAVFQLLIVPNKTLCDLKQYFIISLGLVGWLGSSGQFSLGVSHVVIVRWWLGLESPKDSTGPDIQDGALVDLAADAGC